MTSRTSHRLDAIVVCLLLIGVPLALAGTSNSPRIPSGSGLHLMITGAGCLAWLAWAWCALGLVASVIRHVREGDSDRVADRRGIEALAVRIAGALLSLATLLGLPSASGGATPPAPLQPSGGSAVVASVPPTTSSLQVAPQSAAATYVVQPGDCLWSIAAHLLGDGDSWNLIAAANLGRTMGDGRVFLDPSLIMPGWALSVPSSSSTPTPALAEPASQVPPVPLHALEEVPVAHSPDGATRRSLDTTHIDYGNQAIVVGAGLGSGLVLLGLLRRRRSRRLRDGGEMTTEHLIDADIALARLDMIPMATFAERAISLAYADGRLTELSFLAITDEGATLFASGRERWHAPATEVMEQQNFSTVVPAAMLPLGTEESTTWILLVPRGSHAVLSGPRARDLATQLAALQKDTCWGDRIAVETFVDDADREAAFAETGSLVLFVDLEHQGPVDAELASTIARVSLADNEQPPADVEINEATVTIRSLDRRFDANGLGPSSVELLNLTEEPLEERHEEFPQGDFPLAAELPHQSGVIVRLLTAEPRIDGLLEPIEAKRTRRAVELITYLCLHRPDAVTGDRLRGRVLGSSSEDAASKTLFNVVSAARRALGLDDDGSPLLPPAGRTGLYRISEEVLCDVDLLRWHLNQARSIDDDELLAIGHLRAGLDLIESEPMATVLAGYEWLSIEGHRARFEADIEELAELLVYKALDAGYLTLAKRSLQRARLCIHFSEPLAVAAMEVAAAERDRAGLVHAFGEIRRLTDELDPGCSPPVAIERRFAELLESLREGDQASLAAMDAAPLSTSPSAPAAL